MISELRRAADAKHPVDLCRYRIANGGIACCFVMIHSNINHPVTYGGVTDVGCDRSRHVSIGGLVEYELIVGTGRILGFEVDCIQSISEDVVGQASLSSMAICCIVEDDAHGKDGLGPLLEPPAGLQSGEVEFLLGGALLDDILSREIATNETILPLICLAKFLALCVQCPIGINDCALGIRTLSLPDWREFSQPTMALLTSYILPSGSSKLAV